MKSISLDDKYLLEEAPIFLSGAQAIARLAIDQRRSDSHAGLRTAGFISGYRGSPLGGVDTALWQAGPVLSAHDVRFEPGLNEEIAVTAVSGTQQVKLFDSPYDGVFGIWFAKNPGLDRAADAIKHANAVGTAAAGGVLAVVGDDPGAASSSLPNQCDQAFISALIPILSPSNLEEVIRFGLVGISLSRYSGLWVGLKTVADIIECTGSITAPGRALHSSIPNDFKLPPDGLNARWPDERWDQDSRLLNFRLPAARAFVRANKLDKIAFGRAGGRITIVTAGKAYTDVRQALDELGIDEDAANALGLAIYKVGMVWPLEADRLSEALEGVQEVVVVEERRAVIEPQLKDIAYNWPADRRPTIVGKRDEASRPLFPEAGELSPEIVACAIGARLKRLGLLPHSAQRLRLLEQRRSQAQQQPPIAPRIPHFCSGCPHARSTRVPEGDVAMAGIGCHSLRVWMPNGQTMILPQMGGEGASWFGIAPFSRKGHIFQNLGDGTFMHSGSLAIRAAVATKSNITFRIFCNQATAMTGGQPIEGEPGVADIVRLIAAEGVARIAIVSDETKDYGRDVTQIRGVSVHHRNEYDRVQRELRDVSGVSAIVFDQICATEKRRLVKRGKIPAPQTRAVINARVCDGCGDCVEYSNCAAILPLDTEFGRKRRIDQSSCNTDLSCLEGLCPSFVTVEGGKLRRAPAAELDDADLPQPTHIDRHADIVVVGIGGTGVMTIGAVSGMAAHLEGMASSVLDNTGMARKGGAVSSHVRIAPSTQNILASRIPDGKATLMLVCDLVGAAAPATLAKIERGRTHIVANANVVPTFNQRLDPDATFEAEPIRQRILDAAGEDRCDFIEATAIAERVLGDSIYANMLLFGYAFQKGLVPLPAQAVEEAIRLNGADVPMNRHAFALGRRMAINPHAVPSVAHGWSDRDEPLGAMIGRYAAFLADYQDNGYARRFREVIAKALAAEGSVCGKRTDFTRAAARSLFRLMAIKDEYEIGRLYTDGEFDRAVQSQFSGPYKLRYHMAPMFLARHDQATGRIAKWTFGAWFRPVLAVLAAMRGLRGTPFDVFGWSTERRIERRLIAEYETLIEELISGLRPDNHDLAVEIAGLYSGVRGYGLVKATSIDRIRQCEGELMAGYRSSRRAAA